MGNIKNEEIRMKAKKAGVKLWEVAEALGILDCAFSKLLRREFNEKNKQNILSIIERISSERGDDSWESE